MKFTLEIHDRLLKDINRREITMHVAQRVGAHFQLLGLKEIRCAFHTQSCAVLKITSADIFVRYQGEELKNVLARVDEVKPEMKHPCLREVRRVS